MEGGPANFQISNNDANDENDREKEKNARELQTRNMN